MSLFDDLATNLETNLSLFTTFKIDVMDEKNEALTLRRYQSSPSQRFMDGTRDDFIGLQVLVKSKDQKLAIDTIEAITEYLEKLKSLTSSDGSYKFSTCDIYIHPLLVERTDSNAYLYQTSFIIRIYKP